MDTSLLPVGICQHGRGGETGQSRGQRSLSPLELHSAPDSCEPADTIPGAPAHRKPDTHRAASAVRRGQVMDAHARPAPHHLRRKGCKHENRLRTDRMTVASDTANALPS